MGKKIVAALEHRQRAALASEPIFIFQGAQQNKLALFEKLVRSCATVLLS